MIAGPTKQRTTFFWISLYVMDSQVPLSSSLRERQATNSHRILLTKGAAVCREGFEQPHILVDV